MTDSTRSTDGGARELDALRKNAKRAYKAKDLQEAARFYTAVIERASPEDPVALAADYSGYAAVLTSMNRLADATNQMEQALVFTPQDARLRFKLGEILSRLGRHDEAATQLAECVALEPDVPNNYWRLAMELRTLGRTAEAGEALRKCLELEPGNVNAQILQLEDMMLPTPDRDGQAAEAEEESESGRTIESESWSPSAAPQGGYRRWMLALEAVCLFAAGVWLLSLFSWG